MVEFNQILYAVLMVVVVLFVIIFFTPAKSLAYGILVKFDIITPAIDYSELTEETALAAFENITNIYNNCIESKDNTCTCTKKTLTGFEEFPRLRSNDVIKIQGSGLNTILWFENKEEKQLDQSTFKGVLNCFMTAKKENGDYKTVIEKSPVFIKFDDPRRIYIQRQARPEPGNYLYFIEGAPVLFKDVNGNICFATEFFLTGGITSTTKTEAKNYLNSLNFCFPSNKDDVKNELNRLKGFINTCKNNNICGEFILNLPNDYTLLHKNSGFIGVYYLELSSFNLAYSITELGSYCYNDNEIQKKYVNGDTLKLEKKDNKICLNLVE